MSTRQERLRTAEKLLRQGRLDAAIAEYVKAVEEQPTDWATTNALGDLYVRANKIDQATVQYGRIAEHFWKEGFFPKAAALYKKILKVKPGDESSQLRLAEISARQGLLVDGKANYVAVIEQRRKRGDLRGANEIVVRLGELDPTDLEARLAAARALVSLGDTTKAAQMWSGLAAELEEKGRAEEAIVALRQVVDLEPGNTHARGRLARAYLARGNLEIAREFLTLEVAGNDPSLLLAVAEMELRAGHVDVGREVVRRVLGSGPQFRDQVASLAWKLGEQDPATGFVCAELIADQAIAASDWESAAAVLQECVTRAPHQVDALLKLVEICVDGSLAETMFAAQAQLADAYLATGRAAEASVIAEDLVAREPWDQAHLQRYRDALVQLGHPDPDGAIADRLSGRTPFATTERLEGFGEADEIAEFFRTPAGRGGASASEPAAPMPPPVLSAPPELGRVEKTPPNVPAQPPRVPGRLDRAHPAEPSLELSRLFEEPPKPARPAAGHSMEIDLTSVLGDLNPAQGGGGAPEGGTGGTRSLDDVFQQFRNEASSQQSPDEVAAQQFQLGVAYGDMGRIDDAITALEKAARSLRHRFRSAVRLGRLYREKGVPARAVDWLERAAEAPAPTEDEHRALLYDLGETLEKVGETARAFAVFLELQADAGNYRDVSKRVDRLARVQTGG